MARAPKPKAEEPAKSVVDKIVDAVDSVIHPKESLPEEAAAQDSQAADDVVDDMASHQKFDKFK